MRKLNIMIVNDDGIYAEGLQALSHAMSQVANVYVCAPDGQRSGKSHSITLKDEIRVSEVCDMSWVKRAFTTSGSPADCCKIGLQLFREEGIEIDMVFSGINMGGNLGKDTLYSGTVGAAMEAALGGYQAVAISVGSHDASHFDGACIMAIKIFEKLKDSMNPHRVININVPDIPAKDLKGIRITRLGDKFYDDSFQFADTTTDEENYRAYVLAGNPKEHGNLQDDTDVNAFNKDFVTITPLQFDFTYYDKIKELEEWDLHL